MHSCFCSPHPLWLITHTSFFGPPSFSSFFIRIAIKDRLLFLPFLTHRLLASRSIVYPENFPHQHFFCSSLQPAVLVPSCDTFHNTCLTSAGMTSGQTSAGVWVLELFTAAPDFRTSLLLDTLIPCSYPQTDSTQYGALVEAAKGISSKSWILKSLWKLVDVVMERCGREYFGTLCPLHVLRAGLAENVVFPFFFFFNCSFERGWRISVCAQEPLLGWKISQWTFPWLGTDNLQMWNKGA